MRIVAIDPGATGAIVWGDHFPGSTPVDVTKMPSTLADIYSHLEKICYPGNSIVYIEDVGGYRPGNSGPSAAKFAEHVGALKMALVALQVPHEFVRPAKWEAAFIGKPSYPKIAKDDPERKKKLAARKRERKNKIKARAQERFPSVKVTLVNADALGIWWYAKQQHPMKERPF